MYLVVVATMMEPTAAPFKSSVRVSPAHRAFWCRYGHWKGDVLPLPGTGMIEPTIPLT
jgi:hypothetical protein